MACEHRLKCAIEGIDKDKILVRFSHIDPDDLNAEFSFVLDVSSRAYKGTPSARYMRPNCCSNAILAVPTTTPYLPILPLLLDELNASRDIYAFIRRIRQAFCDLVEQGR